MLSFKEVHTKEKFKKNIFDDFMSKEITILLHKT